MNVLYDTFLATHGYSGIPQDTRLLLKTLASTPGINVDALLHPTQFDRSRSPHEVSALDVSTAIFRDLIPKHQPHAGQLKKFQRKIGNAVTKYLRSRESYSVGPIDKELFFDAIWRTRLDKTLLPSDRALMRSINYKFSPISEEELQKPGKKLSFPRRTLDTSGYDFLIFQDTRVVKAHPLTTKIIRYHDPLPVISPDTFADEMQIKQHYQAIVATKSDSYFVCNSGVTQDQLVRLFPELEDRAFVVPYTLPDHRSVPIHDIPITRIIEARRSFVSAPNIKRKPEIPTEPKYIVMVSTLEPRKNFPGAIAAFERLIERNRDEDLRFVIVGRPGWTFEKTLSAMSSGVKSGRIIHLMDLTFPELANVYRNAEALVFPSYGEGFGFTPMEALQFGTPGVVSDIPVHRWVMGDAVLYADPYDVDAVASQLERLLYGTEALSLRKDLLKAGDAVLDRYTVETTSKQWRILLAGLHMRRQNRWSGLAFRQHKADSDRDFLAPASAVGAQYATVREPAKN